MTNLDDLAKLAPFAASDSALTLSLRDRSGAVCSFYSSSIAAALNERAELRASASNRAREVSALRDEIHAMGVRLGTEQSKNAELRAYRERTEAALREVCDDKTGIEFNCNPPVCGGSRSVFRIVRGRMQDAGLWRDPAPKESDDGR